MTFITYNFRIKDSSHINFLKKKANTVNFVWNYCNQISEESAKRQRGNKNLKWIKEYELQKLTSQSSKILNLSSQSILLICKEFTEKRNKHKKPKLKWRSQRKNLGWIPFRKQDILYLQEDSFNFMKRTFHFWSSRPIQGKIKTGSFNEDAQGRWYINFVCEVEQPESTKQTNSIGIDLGIKTLATLSDGNKIENPQIYNKLEEKLAKAQRAKKKKQVVKLHAKIKNVRKDHIHKETSKLVKQYKQIFIGDVNSLKLTKTFFAKRVLDSGWGLFKSILAYKAIRLGVDLQVINEKYSSVTCSSCLQMTGPSGLSTLGIRNWECSNCKSIHDRDVNAAKNILNFGLGHQTLLEESLEL